MESATAISGPDSESLNCYDTFHCLDQTANHTYQPNISSAQNNTPGEQENTKTVLKKQGGISHFFVEKVLHR